jgi:hypothetical protein
MILKLLGLLLMLLSIIIGWNEILETLYPSYNHKQHIWEMDETKKVKANIIIILLCIVSFLIGYVLKTF